MGQYDRIAATAQKLIAKFGQPAQWQQNGFVADTDKPWNAASAVAQSFPVSIAFLPYQRIGHDFMAYLGKTEVPTGTIVGLMGDVGGLFVPSLADTVLRVDSGMNATNTYLIDDIDRIAPNGQTILWTVYFKR